MKNVRVKVTKSCSGNMYWFDIYEGEKRLMTCIFPNISWTYKRSAIRNAKAMAKRIGIPFDPEIIKQHGC